MTVSHRAIGPASVDRTARRPAEAQASAGPPFKRIARMIAGEIRAGRYHPGDKLPPHRDLADRLAVSVATVSRAYAELSRIGLTIGETGRGTYVRRAPSPQDRDGIPEPAPRNHIDLSINQPAICAAHAAAMQETLAALAQSAARDAEYRLIGYQPSAGQGHHRAAAVQWLAGLGVAARPEDVVVTGGIQQGVMIAVAAAFRPGDVVITEALTNPSFRALASMFRLTLVGARMDGEGMIPAHLDLLAERHKAAGLYVMPSLQNPTGVVMSDRRRAQIAEIVLRRGLKIIENAAYDALLPHPPVPLCALLQEEKATAFHVTGLTKVVCAGLRIGYVVTPPDLARQVAGAIFATTTMVPQVMAEIATRWIRDGTAARLVDWQRTEAGARRDMLLPRLGRLVDGSLPPCNHIWMRLPETWRADQILSLARSRGVSLAAPESFSVNPGQVTQAVRLCLGAGRNRVEIAHAAAVLAGILEGAPILPYDAP